MGSWSRSSVSKRKRRAFFRNRGKAPAVSIQFDQLALKERAARLLFRMLAIRDAIKKEVV